MAWILLPALGCTPADPQDDAPVPDLELIEVEPNDEADAAQAIDLANVNVVRLSGVIADQEDVDLYELGAFHAGDRITVDVNTTGQIDTAAVLFETDADREVGIVFATNDAEVGQADGIDPLIDEVIRHDSDRYFLAIARSFGVSTESGSYEVFLTVQRGGQVPAVARQTVLLDFDGGTVTNQDGQQVAVSAFDAADIDAAYAGQTQAIKQAIVATVKENYRDFGVDIVTTDDAAQPPAGPFSTVYFGQAGVGEGYGASEGLGAAINGTDPYNKDPSDVAIVFAQSFAPEIFAVSSPLSAGQLGTAMGNVGAHELAHLLGLHHTFDPTSLMNTFDAPGMLLLDQRFKMSNLHFTVFASIGISLLQDARLTLAETVGRTDRVANATINVGDTPLDIKAGDLDGDADIDLVAASRFSDEIWILRNNGTGMFLGSVVVNLGAGPAATALFDVDDDDDLDMVSANVGTPDLGLLFNDGQGIFAEGQALTAGDRPWSVAASDFSGDNRSDLAVANLDSGDISILVNDGLGSLASTTSYSVGKTPVAVIAGDLDGDGDDDLAACLSLVDPGAANVSVLRNEGDGTFANAVTMTAGALANSLAAVDLEGDGDLDLAVANSLPSLFAARHVSNLSMLANAGDGTFTSAGEVLVGADAASIAAGDFDGDGDADLAVACRGDLLVPQDTGQVSVLLNNGDGTFAQDIVLTAGAEPTAITAADLDNDADLDLAVANEVDSTVSIFLNDGQGNFGTPAAAAGTPSP